MGHTILDRSLQGHSFASLSSSQIQLDQSLGHFNEQASAPISLASMSLGSLAFKTAHLAFWEFATVSKLSQVAPRFILQGGAKLFALSAEVSAFRSSVSKLTQLSSSTSVPDAFDSKGWRSTFIDFLFLKTGGALSRGQTIFLTHFAQAQAMLLGHEMSARLGFVDPQAGSYIDRLAQAEATNMALAMGMAFAHRISPGLSRLEARMQARLETQQKPALPLAPSKSALPVMSALEINSASGVESKVSAVPEGRIDMWGERLFKDSKSSWLKPSSWRGPVRFFQDILLNEMLRHEAMKKRMIALLDAITSAPDSQLRGLLQKYFPQGGKDASGLLRIVLNLGTWNRLPNFLLIAGIKIGLWSMARRFLAGQTPHSAIDQALRWRKDGIESTLDVVQENVLSAKEADHYTQTVLDLMRDWSLEENIPARNASGLPVRHVSVKLSGMTHRLDPAVHDWALQDAGKRLFKIFNAAKKYAEAGKPVMVNVDLEDAAVADLSYAIFWKTLEHPDLGDWQEAAIVVQAYDTKSEHTLRKVIHNASAQGKKIQVRLVKGAYHGYEQIRAQRNGWPVPVFLSQQETDANYRKLAQLALENHGKIHPAFGSHNLEDIAYIQALREEMKLPLETAEHQFLRGVGNHLAAAMVKNGIPARFYGPFGSQANALGYMVRRLDEVKLTSAIGQTHLSGSWQQYRVHKLDAISEAAASRNADRSPDFTPEPETDFSDPAVRMAMVNALEQVRQEMPFRITPLIDHHFDRRHVVPDGFSKPAQWNKEVSLLWHSSPEEIAKALELSQTGFEDWALNRTGARRAEILFNAANQFSKMRYYFAALLSIEASKPWHLALAEVNEGIDFLRAYAAQAPTLSKTRSALGVGVAITPFNFPFGILLGEIAGGLAAGNAMLVKPSEQTSAIAFKAVQVLHRAGVPQDTLQLLPGDGAVGAALVKSPLVDFIIFTGSVKTASDIVESARLHPSARHGYKLVVAETGGKNAAIVSATADLDVAVKSTLDAAFLFAGQRCSAVSRVFVVDSVADAFIHRLKEGAGSMIVGDAIQPETQVGAVIDFNAHRRILHAIEDGKKWAGSPENIFHGKPAASHSGYFVAPWIFVGSDAQAPFAQMEHFGPLLAVIRVPNFAEALRLTNASNYGLTSALFSRDPEEIRQYLDQIEVGNAYVNRSPTGALVRVQPFGASHPRKDSGTGPKAGGLEYIYRFSRNPYEMDFEKTDFAIESLPESSALGGDVLEKRQKIWSQTPPELRLAWAKALLRELEKGSKLLAPEEAPLLAGRLRKYISAARKYLHRQVTLEKRGEQNEEAHDWPNGIGFIPTEGESFADFASASLAALLMGNAVVLPHNPRSQILQSFISNAAQKMLNQGISLDIPFEMTDGPASSLLNDRQIDFLIAHGRNANVLFQHFLPRLPNRPGFRRVIGGHMDDPNDALYLTRFSSSRVRSEEKLRHGAELDLH